MQLLTPEDVSKMLNIKLKQLYKLTRDGVIPSIRIGRLIRFRPNDIDNFLNLCAKPS